MSGNGTERVIGQLQAEVKNLHDAVDKLTSKVEELNGHMQRQRGGWKVLTVAAAGVGGVAGFVAKYIPHS